MEKLNLKIKLIENIRLKNIPKCKWMQLRIQLNESKYCYTSKHIKKDPLSFTKEIISIPFQRDLYENETILFMINAKIKKQPAESTICSLLLPLRICKPNRRIAGKFTLTPAEGLQFPDIPKIAFQMHIGKKPFENFKDMKVSVDLISEFVYQQNPAPNPIPPIRRRNTTRAPKTNARRSYHLLPNVNCLPGEQMRYQKMIEQAFASASTKQPLWTKIETDPEFIHRCLARFGIKDDTHNN